MWPVLTGEIHFLLKHSVAYFKILRDVRVIVYKHEKKYCQQSKFFKRRLIIVCLTSSKLNNT